MEDSNEASFHVENSVGTLVWVRRRNGSWWPGRVLAAHELRRSHLLCPKSGTPVKLLGKEDASVDWYNIGKSRRIKAFRCGEFDACIEKARSLGSILLKKREKYARREDAILHALELEKKQAEERHLLGVPTAAGALRGFSKFSSDATPHDEVGRSSHNPEHMEVKLPLKVSRSAMLIPQASHRLGSNDVSTSKRIRTPADSEWEDDAPTGIPRMRDLQDFGLPIANSKGRRVICTSSCKNISKVPFIEDGTKKMESCITRDTSGVCLAPSITKVSSSAAQKRKKHQAGSSTDENSCKRRDRRRPLTQVLEKSSTKLADAGFKGIIPPPSNVSGHMLMYRGDGGPEATSSQEPFQQAAVDLKPQSEQKGFELQQTSHRFGYGFKQEKRGSLLVTDKACSSFSSYLMPKCCDGSRWPSYVGAQMDSGLLIGSTFVDSLHGGKPASVFSGPAYTGSATSVNATNLDKSGQTATKRVTWVSKCQSNPLESAIISHASSFGSSHFEGLEMYWSSSKGNEADDINKSLLPSEMNVNADLMKGSERSSRQDISDVTEKSKTCLVGEDEVESFQTARGNAEFYYQECLNRSSNASQNAHNYSSISVISSGNEGLHETGSLHAGVCLQTAQSVSKWQAKGRRNVRKGLCSQGSEQNEDAIIYTGDELEQDQEADTLQYDVNTCMRPLSGLRRRNINVRVSYGKTSVDVIRGGFGTRSMRSHKDHCVLGSSNSGSLRSQDCSDTQRQLDSGWVDVRVEFQGIYKGERVPLVSLMSKVSGRAIVGYPVSVEIAENRYGDGLQAAARQGNYSRSKTQLLGWRAAGGRSALQRVPHSPTYKALDKKEGLLITSDGHRVQPRLKRCLSKKSSRKASSPFQKTRMLSSFPTDEHKVKNEHKVRGEIKEAVTSKASKAPLVTCIPVHVVFDRIREVLYKQSQHDPDKICVDKFEKRGPLE